MAHAQFSGSDDGAFAPALAEELAVADRALAAACGLLPHLVPIARTALLADDILACIRGLINDLARQLADAVEETEAHPAKTAATQALRVEAIASVLAGQGAFLAHFHALALEWRLLEDLRDRHGLDPVLTPLLRELATDDDAGLVALASDLIAAQSRHEDAMRRMAMPLGELPADLHHLAMNALLAAADGDAGAETLARRAEQRLRARHDEALGRDGLLNAILARLGTGAAKALDLRRAGGALFLTALACAAGQSRESVTMLLAEGQGLRCALMLRACGLDVLTSATILAMIHPRLAPMPELAGLSSAEASKLVEASEAGWGGAGWP